MANEDSTAIIPLPKGKKNLVQFGAIMLTVAVACYGLALMTLVPPILQRLDGMSYAGLVGLCISLGITLLSPIGGKLADIFGRKAVVVVAGQINLDCGVGIAFSSNVLVLLICCFGVGFSQGAYVSAPYIIMGLINEKKNVPKAMGYLTMALAIGGTGGSILAGGLSALGAEALIAPFYESDAEEMFNIISEEFTILCGDYLINEEEGSRIAEALKGVLVGDVLKDMYASENRNQFARELIEPLFVNETAQRSVIVVPTTEEIRYQMKQMLQGIVFIH